MWNSRVKCTSIKIKISLDSSIVELEMSKKESVSLKIRLINRKWSNPKITNKSTGRKRTEYQRLTG